MFLFRSKTDPSGRKALYSPPPLNAPAEEAAERTARHLAALKRMGDLGLQFMERAAEEGLDAPKTQAEPAAKGSDHITTFTRITRCVRDTFAMEQRLAAGKRPAAPREAPPPSPREESENAPCDVRESGPRADRESAKDPRRPLIKNFLLKQIDNSLHPKSIKAGFRNQLDPLITETLEADPKQNHPPGHIVLHICEELGIACTTSDMPGELLKPLHRSSTPAAKDAVAVEIHRRIHGHDPP